MTYLTYEDVFKVGRRKIEAVNDKEIIHQRT